MAIDASTTAVELAVIVSQTLEAADILATLSGGGAVSIHSINEYESADLDFVTNARRAELVAALTPLGFRLSTDGRHFEHEETELFIEFPAAPLQFGNRTITQAEVSQLETAHGPLRVITPTQCVMDRLAAYWHWNDRQSWDQAVMVARHQHLDHVSLTEFAREEGESPEDINRLLREAGS